MATGALLIAAEEYPQLQVAPYLRRLDLLAERCSATFKRTRLLYGELARWYGQPPAGTPAGGNVLYVRTGGATQRVRRIAAERDLKVIQEAQAEAEAAAALAAPMDEDVTDIEAELVETPESRD